MLTNSGTCASGESPRPVGEIAARLDLRQPQVTKHLQTLERTGLVEVPNNRPRLVKTAMKRLRPRQETARKQAKMRRLLSLHRGRRRKNSRAT